MTRVKPGYLKSSKKEMSFVAQDLRSARCQQLLRQRHLAFPWSLWRQITLQLGTPAGWSIRHHRLLLEKSAVIPELQTSSVLAFVVLGKGGTNAGITCARGSCGWIPEG